ncbi:putative thiamine transporter SLC35F3 [Paramacrobiotus metropolitanus]|uniref:putative thiamine transporter SLC35F3 n=1 Tax=Paramacrobiotus metropolitanus TaxID=2943436 RepID=UPI002446261E|nr:putative thiamine transporter SLC35F3 [Paramacrobiotus metropolitanus]
MSVSSTEDDRWNSEKPVFIISESKDDLVDAANAENVPEEHKQSTRTWTLAFVMLISYVTLNTVSAQLGNIAFRDPDISFSAPYLFVLFKIIFRALAFPIYIVANTITKIILRRKLDFRRTWWRCEAICGEQGLLTWRVIIFKLFPATFFNLLVQIAYTLGIANLTTSVASALTPLAVSTSYIMTWLFLKHKLLAVKVFFVFVTLAGVSIIAYEKFAFEFTAATILGICSMIVQDLSLSSYQLCFKKAFPKGDLGQVSFAVSAMYVLMILMYWPVPLILKLTGVEQYDIREMPYGILIGSWSCTAVSSMVYGYGLVLASGFFMSLSDLLILASNTVIDHLRKLPISDYQIIGTCVIGAAFIMMVMPDKFVSIDIKKRWQRLRGNPLPPTSSRLVLDFADGSTSSQTELTVPAEMRMRSRSSLLANEIVVNTSHPDLLENVDVITDDATVTAL